MTEIFTIGHSNHSIDRFVDLLRIYGICALVDVRSNPFSRFAPHFNRARLEHALRAAGIDYLYLGGTLGGKLRQRSLCTPDGEPDPHTITASAEFQQSLNLVEELARRKRTVLMCGEGDPARCHRESLLAPALRNQGIVVSHITPDGGIVRSPIRTQQR